MVFVESFSEPGTTPVKMSLVDCDQGRGSAFRRN